MSCAFKKLTAWLMVLGLTAPQNLLACATCYGASDSPLAKGMNMGIMVLLGFIFSVLLGVTVFFIYIIRRANALSAGNNPPATESKP